MGWAKRIYDHSPVWCQNIMTSVQGLHFQRFRWDPTVCRKSLAELRESQWWTEDEFIDYQTRMLKRHIKYAGENVPYYRELFKREGIDPDNIRHIDDIQKIPILEKKTVRDRPMSFLAGGKPSRLWNLNFTSGTTGTPMNLYTSRQSFARIWSFVFRLREWAGIDNPMKPHRIQFTGRDIVPSKQITEQGVYWRRNIFGDSLLMSTSHLSYSSVPLYVDAMRRFKPDLIESYPSAVLITARISTALGLKLPSPRAVIVSAETVLPSHREEIESAFGCKVFNQYASSDTGAFICDCGHGSMHINPEFGICEVLREDGKPASPGEEGEIVATSFCNREQVFIRYRTNDTAVVGSTTRCDCGRSMPRIETITGRKDDILFIPDRGFVGRLDPVFKGLSNISECQIVQKSLNEVTIRIVPAPGYNDEIEAILLENIRKKLGSRVSIAVEKTDIIQRGPNGKFHAVISLCKDQYPNR